MIKYPVALFVLLSFVFRSVAQDTIPHLKGKMDISIIKGTIECDFTLSNIPRISDYYIRLNAGMNIRYIKSLNGMASLRYSRSTDDTLATGEASAYFLKAYTDNGKFLPRAIRLSYVGMYPVFTDTSSFVDWKGNIAFNGKTVRTDGSQTAWYPVLYDIKKDLRYDKVTYDIEVNCSDCKTIYINGSEPVESTHAIFKSDRPQELTMFSGDYRMVAINGSYFLNPDLDDNQLKELEGIIHSNKVYYENNLQIPYRGTAAYIQTTPVSKNNSWMFATYPTIVNIGFGENGMKTFLDKKKGDGFKPYMAHELAHYYFGKYRVFNAELGDMISEGFSEYLSLNITRKLISDSVFNDKLESKFRALRNFKPVPFASVKSKNDYDDRELYVYYYAPLIFTAIEKEIGEEAMWKWIRSLLQTPVTFTNYHFLEQTLSVVLNNKSQMEMIRTKYFTTDNVINNAATTLGMRTESQTASVTTEQVAKTYYYFFFLKPAVDAGAPENRTVKHTEIGEITCTQAELSKMAQAKFKQVTSECENEAGCGSDFNTYDSLDKAKAALQRWLKPFVGNAAFVIKTINL